MTLVADLHAGGLGARVAAAAGLPLLALEYRRFPDGETYLRVDGPVEGRAVWIVASLSPPDPELVALLLLAGTLREQGAASVRLLAPYLPYLRQDTAFRAGECVSARQLAALLRAHLEELLTVDAHLHRIPDLGALIGIPARNLSTAPLIARWIGERVPAPLLVGPDSESAQWVSAAAAGLGCPWTVLEKRRAGDRAVSIRGRIDPAWRTRQPVLLDDMISTGGTLLEACALLRREGLTAPGVAVVHGIFAGDAEARLREAGVAFVASSDSLPHPSNAIALAPLLAAAISP